MSESLTQAVTAITHLFTTSGGQPTTALLTVAAYTGGSLILYGLTRGREFLISGYTSILFLAPFVNFH